MLPTFHKKFTAPIVTALLLLSFTTPSLPTYAEEACKNMPCKVTFTLDEANNLVVKHIQPHHKDEGVILLTSKQAEEASQKPIAPLNPAANNEFADTLKTLARIPGLGFLKPKTGETTPTKHTLPHNRPSKNGPVPLHIQQCAQAKTFIAATRDAAAPQEEQLTAKELAKACAGTF